MDSLPDWLQPLPDAERMRAIDCWAIEERGVPSLDLMERAGVGVARKVERLAPDGAVVVMCGTGNNGGDGLVVARLLREAGRRVTVVCAGELAKLSADARANLERLPGAAPVDLAHGSDALAQASVIVDALLGTGFAGEPRGEIGAAITAITALDGRCAPVVSVDVPSGVNASTGTVADAAICAAATVTFHAAKPGLWIHPGKAHAGEVEVVDIGVPRGAERGAPTDGVSFADEAIGLIDEAVLALLPRRGADSTKFSSGHVLVTGGSRGLTGAPRMSALGAMRAGAGYVTACVPASLQAIVAGAGTPELMTRGLPDTDSALALAGVEVVLEAARRGGALALGPGLGRGEQAVAFARALARRAETPLVLDADGLNAHAGSIGSHGPGHLDDLSLRSAATVLTPHPGELARLLDTDSAHIARERLACARAAAKRARAVVVLKGDDTLVVDPGGQVAVSPGGSPALATAGSGDVLTGVIAALLAQGLEPFAAAAGGVLLHVRAGRLAAHRQGSAEGVLATDVAAALPAVRWEGTS